MTQYKNGDQVRFRTSKMSVYHGDFSDEIVEWEGRVNGKARSVEGTTLIPVWCECVGKQSTTIYVDEDNVIAKDTDQAFWDKRTLDVHDAAAKFYSENRPPKKIKPKQ